MPLGFRHRSASFDTTIKCLQNVHNSIPQVGSYLGLSVFDQLDSKHETLPAYIPNDAVLVLQRHQPLLDMPSHLNSKDQLSRGTKVYVATMLRKHLCVNVGNFNGQMTALRF